MLSATDVHYLVGLLTLVSAPDSIEVMLGNLVYDVKAEEERDVDVTVTYQDKNGIISAFNGIEVKKHGRPLDITHVEQLWAKLSHMPNISHRAIVSASGYTRPARKMATACGVDLLSLIPWGNEIEGFSHIKFSSDLIIRQQTLSWVSSPSITFNPQQQLPRQITSQITDETPIYSDVEQLNIHTIRQLCERISLVTLQQLMNQEEIKSIALDKPSNVSHLFDDFRNVYIKLSEIHLPLQQVLIQGIVGWTNHDIKPEFKVLVKDGEFTPYVGCAIAELQQGNLVGFTVSQADRNLNFINVPLSDRNRNKIKQLRLK